MAIKIFFSYAHANKKHLKQLKKHLRPFQRLQLIDTWHDGDIMAGTDREYEINQHLNTAQIILLLVSPDFIGSEYCYSVEMKRALERHEQGKVCVIPVILKPVYWQATPFGNLQPLPKNNKPIINKGKKNKDIAFLSVAEGVLEVIQSLLLKECLGYCGAELYKEALGTIEQALSSDRKYVATLSNKGYILSDLKHYDLKYYKEELVNALDKAFRHISQDSYSLAWYVKGKLLHDLKRNEEARKAYNHAMQLGKNDIDIHRDRAITLYDLKEYEEALIAFNKALHFDPEDVWILTQKGITMRNLKRAEEALTVHDEAIRLSPKDAWVITEKAITLRCFKRFDEALVEHKRAMEVNENDAWAKAQEAITLRDAHRWGEALEAHDRAIELNQNDAWLISEKAITLRLWKRFDEALVEHRRAIELDKNDAWTQEQEAITLRDAHRCEESIEAHKKAIKLNQYDAGLHLEMAKTLHNCKKYEEAIVSYDEAIRLSHNDARYVTWKAIALRDSSL